MAAKKKSAIERGMGHPESAADDFVKGIVKIGRDVYKRQISPKKIKDAARHIKSIASQDAFSAHANKQYYKITGSKAVDKKVKAHLVDKSTHRSLRVVDRKEDLTYEAMNRLGLQGMGIKAKGIGKAYQSEYNAAAAKFSKVRKATPAPKKAPVKKTPVKKAPVKKAAPKKK